MIITQSLKEGVGVMYGGDGSVTLDYGTNAVLMTAAEFAEFMPLAMHVYHARQMQPGVCAARATALTDTNKSRELSLVNTVGD